MTLVYSMAVLSLVLGGGFALGLMIVRLLKTSRQAPQAIKHTHCGSYLCGGRSDPRCAAGNCTFHCNASIGCGGRCLDAWATSDDAEKLAREVMQKAKARID